MIKKVNLILATLYAIILAAIETIMNTYWADWQYAPL